MTKIELWRDVVGYEGYYMVSDCGRVMNVKSGRILKLFTGRRYVQLNLYKNGLPTCCWVHRLVLCAFKGLPKDDQECNHKDGVKHNNRLRNLEWMTRKENVQHRVQVLKFSVGKTHYAYGKFGSANFHSKEFMITSPEGEKYKIVGLRHFCKDHNLDTGTMSAVASGKHKKHKGWRCERV